MSDMNQDFLDAPQPKPDLARGEMHTKENTTVKNPTEIKDPVMGDLDKEKLRAALNVFLGTQKAPYQRLEELMEHWLRLNLATDAEPRAEASEISALKSNLEDYIKSEFSSMQPEEVNDLANRFYNFLLQMVEDESFRHRSMLAAEWRNQTETSTGELLSDIRQLKPSSGGKFSMRDSMRRGVRRAKGDAENISILLRNSFISIRISRPTNLELGRLIQNINNEIRGYVRRVNSGSLTLTRSAIIRVIWRFISDRIVWCSVKDTQNYFDLQSSILVSDIGTLMIGLINATTTRGVDMMLEHHSQDCNWVGYKRVDPSLLVFHNDDNLSEEQAAALGNLFNQTRTYSREEVEKLQALSTHNLENQVFSDDKTTFLTIKEPTLENLFIQFDAFVKRINPSINEARSNNINDDQYNIAVNNIINSVGACEYAQWVSELTLMPESSSDDEPVVHKRSENPEEFSEGLIDVLGENNSLNSALIRYVRTNAPAMTFTVIGVPNFLCPKCKKDASVTNGNVNGITPIDPVMAFFIHTQLTLTESIRNQIQLAEDLS